MRSICGLMVLIYILTAGYLHAQEKGSGLSAEDQWTIPGGPEYDFDTGQGCHLKVGIWGFVRNPGRYRVACETDLLKLLSMAGGAIPGALLDNVLILRRPDADSKSRTEVRIDLAKYDLDDNKSESASELGLFPGDLIVVDGMFPATREK